MLYYFHICLFSLTIVLAQNRSLVFTTGVPLGECSTSNLPCASTLDCTLGEECIPPPYHTIQNNPTATNSLSDRIYVNNRSALEALKIYAVAINPFSTGRLVFQEDNDGMPGAEIFSWDVNLPTESNGNNYFLIMTTGQCIYLEENTFYWLTLHAEGDNSNIAWYYSNNPTFTYSTSSDLGVSWQEPEIGNSGSASIYAEYIYEPEINDSPLGDTNSDGSLNVLDVVILANLVIAGEYIQQADVNSDGLNNVLDVVALVNTIVTGGTQETLPVWDYVDINPNSEFYNQLIGPNTFNGNVSIYYFGKAG